MSRSTVYPHIVYAKDGSYKIVQTEAERDALGKGWQDTPFPACDPEPEADPVEERFAAIEARVELLEAKKKR